MLSSACLSESFLHFRIETSLCVRLSNVVWTPNGDSESQRVAAIRAICSRFGSAKLLRQNYTIHLHSQCLRLAAQGLCDPEDGGSTS